MIGNLVEVFHPLEPHTVKNHFVFILLNSDHKFEILLLFELWSSLPFDNENTARTITECHMGTINHLFYFDYQPNDRYLS
jgi:hypothetical protein